MLYYSTHKISWPIPYAQCEAPLQGTSCLPNHYLAVYMSRDHMAHVHEYAQPCRACASISAAPLLRSLAMHTHTWLAAELHPPRKPLPLPQANRISLDKQDVVFACRFSPKSGDAKGDFKLTALSPLAPIAPLNLQRWIMCTLLYFWNAFHNSAAYDLSRLLLFFTTMICLNEHHIH